VRQLKRLESQNLLVKLLAIHTHTHFFLQTRAFGTGDELFLFFLCCATRTRNETAGTTPTADPPDSQRCGLCGPGRRLNKNIAAASLTVRVLE